MIITGDQRKLKRVRFFEKVRGFQHRPVVEDIPPDKVTYFGGGMGNANVRVENQRGCDRPFKPGGYHVVTYSTEAGSSMDG